MMLIYYLITGVFVLFTIYCVFSSVNSRNKHQTQNSKSDQSYWNEILKKYQK